MDVTSHLVTQAIFRVSFATCLTLGIVPVALSPHGFLRGNLAALFLLNALAAALIYLAEDSGSSQQLQFVLAACLAAASGMGAVFWSRRFAPWSPYLVFALGLTAFLASLSTARWDAGTTGFGLTLAVADLASGGLLLATILSAVLLTVWHLCTPTMAQVRLAWIVRLLALAVGTRTLLTVVATAAQLFQSDFTTLTGIFLLFRCMLPGLGLWMLILLKRDVEEESGETRTSGTLLVGLIVALIGELATHLVPIDGLYPV